MIASVPVLGLLAADPGRHVNTMDFPPPLVRFREWLRKLRHRAADAGEPVPVSAAGTGPEAPEPRPLTWGEKPVLQAAARRWNAVADAEPVPAGAAGTGTDPLPGRVVTWAEVVEAIGHPKADDTALDLLRIGSGRDAIGEEP